MSKKAKWITGLGLGFLLWGGAVTTFSLWASGVFKKDETYDAELEKLEIKKIGENKIQYKLIGFDLSTKKEEYKILIGDEELSKFEIKDGSNAQNIFFISDYNKKYVGKKVKIQYKTKELEGNSYPAYIELNNATSEIQFIDNNKSALIKITLSGEYLTKDINKNYEVYIDGNKVDILDKSQREIDNVKTLDIFVKYNSDYSGKTIKVKCIETKKEIEIQDKYPKIAEIASIKSISQVDENVEITIEGKNLSLLNDATKFNISFGNNKTRTIEKDWTIKSNTEEEIILTKIIDARRLSNELVLSYNNDEEIINKSKNFNYVSTINLDFKKPEIIEIFEKHFSLNDNILEVYSLNELDGKVIEFKKELNSIIRKYKLSDINFEFNAKEFNQFQNRIIKQFKVKFKENISLTNDDLISVNNNFIEINMELNSLISEFVLPNGKLKIPKKLLDILDDFLLKSKPFGENYEKWEESTSSSNIFKLGKTKYIDFLKKMNDKIQREIPGFPKIFANTLGGENGWIESKFIRLRLYFVPINQFDEWYNEKKEESGDSISGWDVKHEFDLDTVVDKNIEDYISEEDNDKYYFQSNNKLITRKFQVWK